MSPNTTHSISWLLEQLADPFSIFPLQEVARSLTNSIAKASEDLQTRGGTYGVARKYWDLPMEMADEGIGVAIGSAFVLGQAAIVQAVSIVRRIHKLTNAHPAIPTGKRKILELAAIPSATAGLGNVAIIDIAANYFKHHHEWPENWHEDAGTGVQQPTISDARLLGMSGQDLTHNMYAALDALRIRTDEVFTVPMTVQDWRERLASKLSIDLGLQESAPDEA